MEDEFRERWEDADPVERRYQLEALGRDLTERYEAPAPHLYPERYDNERLLGRYADADFRIEMNERLLEDSDPQDALDTYLHEYRHAEQNYEVTRSHGAMAAQGDAERAEMLEHNFDHYAEPAEDEDRYYEQPVERDARDFARRETQRFLHPEQGE